MGKKIASLALAVCLVLALMTGCWGKSDSSSSSSSSSSTPKPSASSSSSMSMDSSSMGSSSMENSSGMTGSSSMPMDTSSGSTSTSKSEAAKAAAPLLGYEQVLVNAQNPLPKDFTVKVSPIATRAEKTFDSRAVVYLDEMLAAAQKAGFDTFVVSGYRTYDYQKGLFDRKVKYYIAQGLSAEMAQDKAATWVARPGTSEHNLGLAVDIVSGDWYLNNSDLTEEFDKTPLFGWLAENAADFGFILRYEKGKEALTGVCYEPWHYRYVGKEMAQEIKTKGICLEEYK
ncbi:MAG: M15 family metallopeptidase [Oscillospiraceae bacterium]